MNRYLLYISYIGTKFRGIQKNIIKDKQPCIDNNSIQGCIELALQKLRPINIIQVLLSSRTDAGVHALESTIHVNLERYNGTLYPTLAITTTLNKNFVKNNLPIRIIKTIHVPDTFHCRFNAKARTYLYRIAVIKKDITKNENPDTFVPIEDIERCLYIQNENFQINELIEASKLFIGRHDFRTFMSTSRNKIIQDLPLFTIRKILDIKINKVNPPINSFDYEKANNLYTYWNIEITGKSFLYKQVRRMVGSLIAVGLGKITNHHIYEMLTIPSKNSWNNSSYVIPAFGLYLCKVHYNDEDLKFNEHQIVSEETKKSS